MNPNEPKPSPDFLYLRVMIDKQAPELRTLLRKVEEEFGKKVATSADFESLSTAIWEHTRERVSSSTLKRLWGYVSLSPVPRTGTLDILANYLGHKTFQDFCKAIALHDENASDFFSSTYLSVASLQTGAKVQIGWAPNRLVTLEYLGNFLFEVEESLNSKLLAGDRFELTNIMIGYPLFIQRILRDGEYTPSYVAGKTTGIDCFKVL